MPNPESNPGGSTGETGKIPRDVAEERGRKTAEAMLEKLEERKRELLAERRALEGSLVPPIRPEGGTTSTGEKKPASKEIDKAKESKPLGRVLTGVVAGVLATALAVGAIAYVNNQNADTDETPPTDDPKANAGEEAYAGETEAPAPSPADNYEPTSSNAGTPVEEESPEENLEEDNGEQEKNIAEISTYHGKFASEDGSTYNKEKRQLLDFGPSLKTGVSEDEMKADFTEKAMTQTGPLAAIYLHSRDTFTDPALAGVEGADFEDVNDLVDAMEKDPDLHQRVFDYMDKLVHENSMREDTVNGLYTSYVADSNFETGDIDTSKVIIKGCESERHNEPVYILTHTYINEAGEKITEEAAHFVRCGGQPGGIKLVRKVQIVENPVTPEYTPTSSNINPDTPPGKPDTPPVTPPGKPDTPPVTPPAPKDYENTGRIDNNTLEDSSGNSGTGKTDVNPSKVDPAKVTSEPTDYDGTTYEFVANDASGTASTVDPDKFSPGNSYGSDRGGPHYDEYAPNKDSTQPKEPPIAVGGAPTEGQDLADGLSELGINR